ncbi:hypothetical protein AR274_06365 [Stenotrophomonas maltophilia]|nr:hypothetical protein AR274_06365 [Stenotrophomonas maltophilia]KZC91448.1 hypothetical protein AR273_06630 [Stenotrophomonas maltophilia]
MMAGMLQYWLAWPLQDKRLRGPAASGMCPMRLMRWPSLARSDYLTADLAATLPNRTGLAAS